MSCSGLGGSVLLEAVISGILGEVDLDDLVSKKLISSSDSVSAVLHKVSIHLVEGHLQVGRSVKANSLSLADNAAWQDEVIEDCLVDCSKGPAVGTFLALAELSYSRVYLDPAGLDGPCDDEQYGGLQLLFELNVKLLGVVLQNLQEMVRDEKDESRFLTLVLGKGELDSFGHLESLQFSDGTLDFSKCSTDLSLNGSEILNKMCRLLCFSCRIVQLP